MEQYHESSSMSILGMPKIIKKLLLLSLVALLSCGTGYTQTVPLDSSINNKISLIEQKKLDIEREKLSIEKQKLMQQWIAGTLTLLTVIITGIIAYNTIKNNQSQAKLQSKLKAIDVVMSAAGPHSAFQRLQLVDKILGESLLGIELKTKDQIEIQGIGIGHDHNRKDLIKLLIDNPEKTQEILALWSISFGNGGMKNDIIELANYYTSKQPAKETEVPKVEASTVKAPNVGNPT